MKRQKHLVKREKFTLRSKRDYHKASRKQGKKIVQNAEISKTP